MPTEQRIAQLKALGYTVEDMQKAWGDGWWNGMFRWMHNGDEDFDFGVPQSSEAAAWADCDQYQRSLYLLQE